MKIKVCDVVRNSVWYDPRVIKQIDEYVKADFDVYVIGEEDNRYNATEIERIPASVRIVKIKDKYKRFQNKINTVLKEISVCKSLAKEIAACKPDIIHANDLDALLAAYIATRSWKCKIVFDTHEVYTDNFGMASAVLKKLFWSFVEFWIIKRVDLVVCVSNAAADYFAAKYNIPKPLVVTNCAKRQRLHEHENVKSSYFEVLNHGQFYEGRGYDIMVEAAAISRNTQIKYVLRGFGRMEPELRSFVDEKGLTNVTFAPPVKTTELIPAARTSHVGLAITVPINLNFKLSVSNKIFEYVSAGLPVIMSDIPEHRYLNDKYNFGIILKENTAECLRDAVMTMYENEELYREYSANAKRLSEELNWETEFAKLLAIEKQMQF
ncbi:MAG: glycosyltransferase [Bacteroidaceae bacterium]|nr:glycosyltransferase [Bacteroidaceae bacterium]